MTDAAAILRRHQTLKAQRASSVENTWRDCFDLTYPLRGSGLNAAVVSANDGQAKQAQNLDSTAADSVNVLASNIMAGLTPANALWFALDVGNESDEERRWLDESAELLWENIHMANFDAEGFEACMDIVCAGMFALFIDEDREKGGLTFHQWPLASVFAASTRADGRIDIVHREYTLTAEQAVREFGATNLPKRINDVAATTPDEPFTFVQALYPRTPHVVGARLAKNLPIASCHIEVGSSMVVRESGYHEMPVVVPRWIKAPGSVYAIGPMYAALPDVRRLNEICFLQMASADIQVCGMYVAADDGVFNARTAKIGPRKILVAAEADNIKPLTGGGDFNVSEALIDKLQASIRKTLMADQLPPPDGPAKTAYEYSVRMDMIRKLLGPIYGRLQAEYLKPLVERCFGLASRAGIFKPAPQSLRNRSYSVRYVSPMARSQKLDEVNAVIDTFMTAGQFAEFEPTIMDELDAREGLKIIQEGRGAPASIRRKPEDVAARQKARVDAQKTAQQEQVAMETQAAGAQEAAKRAVAA